MKSRKFIGILIICIGVGICSYPIIRQTYSAKRQAELKDAFYEILQTNEEVDTPEVNVTSGDSLTYDNSELQQTAPIQEVQPTTENDNSEYIDFEETDVAIDTQTADNIKDRLNGQTVIGLIEIEKIDMIYAIVEGTSNANLGVAIGHMSQTAAIGEEGNCALAGHRGGTSGPYFKNINKLSKGDEIKITDTQGDEFIYLVTESYVVEPTEMSVIQDVPKQKLLTLITCQESGTKRLIVRAICK